MWARVSGIGYTLSNIAGSSCMGMCRSWVSVVSAALNWGELSVPNDYLLVILIY